MSDDKKKKSNKPMARDKNGRLKPGHSGNPNGRPKIGKLTGTDKKELDRLVRAGDMKEILAFLCARAHHVADAFKYIKEFAPYLAPKLQTINSINKNDNTFTIEWKSQLIKKVEDIDAEYEKLTNKENIQVDETTQKSISGVDAEDSIGKALK